MIKHLLKIVGHSMTPSADFLFKYFRLKKALWILGLLNYYPSGQNIWKGYQQVTTWLVVIKMVLEIYFHIWKPSGMKHWDQLAPYANVKDIARVGVIVFCIWILSLRIHFKRLSGHSSVKAWLQMYEDELGSKLTPSGHHQWTNHLRTLIFRSAILGILSSIIITLRAGFALKVSPLVIDSLVCYFLHIFFFLHLSNTLPVVIVAIVSVCSNLRQRAQIIGRNLDSSPYFGSRYLESGLTHLTIFIKDLDSLNQIFSSLLGYCFTSIITLVNIGFYVVGFGKVPASVKLTIGKLLVLVLTLGAGLTVPPSLLKRDISSTYSKLFKNQMTSKHLSTKLKLDTLVAAGRTGPPAAFEVFHVFPVTQKTSLQAVIVMANYFMLLVNSLDQ